MMKADRPWAWPLRHPARTRRAGIGTRARTTWRFPWTARSAPSSPPTQSGDGTGQRGPSAVVRSVRGV